MFQRSVSIGCAVAAVLTVSSAVRGQDAESYEAPNLATISLSGPRLGVTGVVPDGRAFDKKLKEEGISRIFSQFGWHFEWLVKPEGGGPCFVVELIPMFGGVENSVVIPSLSTVMGIRMQNGFEFGMGPNVRVVPIGDQPLIPSLVVGVGKSLYFNGVSIPLNLSAATSRDGTGISFTFGYALVKKERVAPSY